MAAIRPALKLYVVAVVAAGLVALLAVPDRVAPAQLPIAALLLALATVAQLRPLHLTQKIKITVDDTATFAAALLVDPWLGLVVASASTLLAYTRRRGAPWFEAPFNAAASGLATYGASVLYRALGGEPETIAASGSAVALAAAARYLLQTTTIDVAVGLQLRRDPVSAWWRVHRRDLPQSLALYGLGALAALVASAAPFAVALFALPVGAVFLAMREAARLRTQTRQAIVELAKLIDLRDRYTHGHSQRVADLAERMARRMRLDPTQIELVRDAALLHDLGKIRTGDHILQKPGPLDNLERDEMRLHAEAGADLLRQLPDFWEGAVLVRAHHEHYDGTGYPRGLAGTELPIEAAIIAVADAWDAMTSDRPYRGALSLGQARAELLRYRGTQWAPACADALLAILDEQHGSGAMVAASASPAV